LLFFKIFWDQKVCCDGIFPTPLVAVYLKAEAKVSRNGPERRSGEIIVAGTAFRLEFQVR